MAEAKAPLNIERDYDPSLPDLDANREQLIQALLNIMLNAVQVIAENGRIWINTRVKRKFTIRQQVHKLVVQIEIIDDGPGVPKEIQNTIFYPMVTGRADGTGLGLSIAQSLIHAHGGIIEHERSGNRTHFRVFLPIGSRDD
jgi:two-component system nitrogen regulation sensor histidine kinase GlnL